MGHGTFVRQKSVAAWFTIWLNATVEKSAYCHLNDRPPPFNRRPNTQPDNRIFADGCVHDAPGKFDREVLGGFERAAKRADVLPVKKDPGIFGQSPRLRLADCFQIRDTHVVS